MRNWVTNLCGVALVLMAVGAEAAIPTAAQEDDLFALGYLVCDYYANVNSVGAGDNTVGTDDLNTCIVDAYNNQLAATLNVCGGTYVVTNSVVLYEWVDWNDATNAPRGAPAQAHTFRGREGTGCARPTIKIKTCSPNFTDTGAPRPVVAYRSFEATNTNNQIGLKPSHALGLPANHDDGGGVYMEELFHNIDIDTSACAGAIGLTQLAGQSSAVTNSKITATGSYAGFFGPPGRNGLVGNVEIVGGSYGLVLGKYANLGNHAPQQGTTFAGFTASGQTIAAMRLNDQVPTVVVGFTIAKSSNGPALLIEGGGLALIDGQITMSGAATNDVVVDNSRALNVYSRSVYVSGSNQIFQSDSGPDAIISGPSSAGTWARVVEYAATDQTNRDGTTVPSTYPETPPAGSIGPYESRSLITNAAGVFELAGNTVPLAKITSNSEPPPSDLLSRHIWSTLPSVWDSLPCIRPSAYGAQPILGTDYPTVSTDTYDSAPDVNQAITAAASAGHNRVCLERGSYVIGDTIDVGADTKLIGAGMRKSGFVAKSNWNPSAPVAMLETANSAAGTAYMGFFTLYHKTTPFANDFIHHLRWRTGKNSSLLALDLFGQFLSTCSGGVPKNQQRYAIWLSGNGGGRFWMNQQQMPTGLDRNINSRLIFLDGNTQPASFYGNNLEGGKSTTACGRPYSNMEVKNNNAGVRSYGTKREGSGGTLYINNSSNIGMFGMGAMTEGLPPASEGYNVATPTSSNYVIGATTVRQNKTTNVEPIFKIAGSTEYIPWPNGASVISNGSLDDGPFGTVASSAPDLSAVIVDTVDQVDVKFNIYDGVALLPAPPTGAIGLTFTVGGTLKTPTGSVVRVGNDTYRATFLAGTITSGVQEVRVTYTPGNITAGGAGTPAAVAFTNIQATNSLPPGTSPVYTLEGFMLRSISGGMGMDSANSPPYENTQGEYENAPGRFLPNSEFRVHLQMSVNNAAAPTQAFSICWEQNESGTFALLTDDCSVNKTCFTNAPDLADGAPTLQQLTPAESTFVTGGLLESVNTQVNVTMPQDSETTYEAGIRLSGTTVGHRYRYRLCKAGGAPLDSYPEANVALVTVISQRSEANGGVNK